MLTYTNDDTQQVCFAVEVRVPTDLAALFAAAMTGNDDDIVLAAEKAMNGRIGTLYASCENVEMSATDGSSRAVKRELLDVARSVA